MPSSFLPWILWICQSFWLKFSSASFIFQKISRLLFLWWYWSKITTLVFYYLFYMMPRSIPWHHGMFFFFFFPVFPGARNGNPLQYSCLGSHGQRSQVGYSSWGHKRVGHNLGTKPPPLLSLGLPVELLSPHGELLTITAAPFPSPYLSLQAAPLL